MLRVSTTLVKQFPSGVISTWKFGRLPNGWFAAKCLENGHKKYFRSLKTMEACIRNYTHKYGYQKTSAILVKQLALAI